MADFHYVYLASPYTHPDPFVREARFKAACKAAADLMLAGEIVFCPIAHSHPIDLCFGEPGSGEFWKRQDHPFLAGAVKVKVLCLRGWDDSHGVMAEIAYARDHNIPVEFI